MTGRGRRPRRWRELGGLLSALGAVAVVASACGGSSGGSTTVTYVAVANGAISFGTTGSPTGCNPNTPTGDTPGTLTALGGVLPSPYVVDAAGMPSPNSALIESAEPVSISPQTIVYTLNPKAVWSDGVPITADDFGRWLAETRRLVADGPDLRARRRALAALLVRVRCYAGRLILDPAAPLPSGGVAYGFVPPAGFEPAIPTLKG